MIKLKPFKQSTGYCGPASLKMVFSAYGVEKSERTLAKLAKASKRKGCLEKDMLKAARKLGFNAYSKEKCSVAELKKWVKKGTPPIVGWFSPEGASHYSVVVGFRRNSIFLADPNFGKIREHKIAWFKERWFDKGCGSLLVREVIVIKKKGD
ncbi:MAG: cysteine peptidase family C39 domain-containing protein [Candidatus Woesearchaeota archaeon]